MTVTFHHLVHNLNVINCKQKRESKRVTKRKKSTQEVNNNAMIEFWRFLTDCTCVEPTMLAEVSNHYQLSLAKTEIQLFV